jgi:CrcB protein
VALVSALTVGIGGAVGAVSRYAVGLAVERRALDTAAVNVAGSFVLGVLVGITPANSVALAIGVGFCGAFTTFSSFAVETVSLAEDDGIRSAAVNAVGTLVAALAAALAGVALAGTV